MKANNFGENGKRIDMYYNHNMKLSEYLNIGFDPLIPNKAI